MFKIILLLTFLISTFQLFASNAMVFAEKQFIYSKAFDSEREYYIHLPESYSSKKDKKYPVLYVLRGQSETLNAVATVKAIENDLPEFIIVGIQSKGRELLPDILEGGGENHQGKSFKTFVFNELIPHISKTYPVAGFEILSGHSNSGRFVMNTLLDEPQKFDAYFASSPSIDDYAINKKANKQVIDLAATNTHLIMTLANEGEHMEKPFDELVTIFQKSDKNKEYFHHQTFTDQTHASTAIVSQLYALRTLFNGWRPSWDIKVLGLAALQEHYQQLSNRYGFSVEIAPLHLLQMSFVFARMETEEGDLKAEQVVTYALNNYPDIAAEFIDVVDQLELYGHKQASVNLNKLVCDKLKGNNVCNS